MSMKQLLSWPDFARRPGFRFIARRSGPFDGTVTLGRERVYILPTRAGLIFAALLLVLLIGSINYGKSLGFALTFLLIGIGNVSLYATWRNLAGLKIRSGGCPPVFAGDMAAFTLQLENPDAFDRYVIELSIDGRDIDLVDIPANSIKQMSYTVKSHRRGWLDGGRFRLYTQYPGGLFVAWTWLELSMQCLVYPQPVKQAALPVSAGENGNEPHQQGEGMEEFSHLEKFQQGDNWRRICWKSATKSERLYSKHFTGGAPQPQWISWHDIMAEDTELRLSTLTRLVMDAHAQHQRYGLILPDRQIKPETGNTHYHHCLKQLALYRNHD
ncbi:MAG TPA: DUF58 domain-containing protein [Thiotrichales bacterium]|nr:DUF58 domain-containing protein [Thiotrichales bacterium]